METWATFSIIDHRKPIYRQALALFDRIVVPVPPEPIGDQTKAELEQLRTEVEYLARHKAAEIVDWKRDTFETWRQPLLAEAAAAKINRDPFQDTRLMIAEELNVSGVQAIPVYGALAEFHQAKTTLPGVEEALTLEILQRLPVPEEDTPLENLIRLRDKPEFRTALENLHEWKRSQVPMIFLSDDPSSAMRAAVTKFEELTKKYAEAMASHGFKKTETIGSIFFSVVKLDIVDIIKDALVSFRELREPCWKKVSEMKCAPGGIIYHFGEGI